MAELGCLTFKLLAIKPDRQIKAAGFVLVKLYFKGKSQGNTVINNILEISVFYQNSVNS